MTDIIHSKSHVIVSDNHRKTCLGVFSIMVVFLVTITMFRRTTMSQSTTTFLPAHLHYTIQTMDTEGINVNITQVHVHGNNSTSHGNTTEELPIYIRSQGRLGNKMFQLASAIGIARKNGRPLIIDSEFHGSVNHLLALTQNTYFKVGDPPLNVTILEQKYGHVFYQRYFSLPNKPIEIRGYFQSYKYFRFMKSEIRQLFTFNKKYVESAKLIISDIKENYGNTAVVAVHVRRRDILSQLEYCNGMRVPRMTYFLKAMEYFKRRYHMVHFVICTDDVKWCQKHFGKLSDVTISDQSADIDLSTLTQCDDIILSVGSYGWWAGWLNEGTVVYFDKPYADNRTEVMKADYFLPQWKPLGN